MKIEPLLKLRKQECAASRGDDSAFVSTLFNPQSLQLMVQYRRTVDPRRIARARKVWMPKNIGQWLSPLSIKRANTSGIIVGLLLGLLLGFNAAAATPPTGPSPSVALAWNASTGSGVSGYRVYYGTTRSNYTSQINAGTNTSVVISGLVAGQTNYFAVKAYNAAGTESAPSNEIKYFVPGILTLQRTNAMGPAKVQFPVAPNHWYELQASTNLKTWTTIWTTSVTTSNTWLQYTDAQAATMPLRYYRLVNH